MAKISENYAPYAFTGNILDILHRLRDASLPEVIDTGVVVKIGVSEGNSHRTVATLQYLGLIDEEGTQTKEMKNLAKASTADYPSVLAEIIRNGYARIFQIVNPTKATETEIMDAFRGSEPASQWKRMGILFIDLCKEAGIIANDPATAEKQTETRKPAKNNQSNSNSARPKTPKFYGGTGGWYSDLQNIFDKLPDRDNPKWSSDTKQKWLKALESMLDLMIDIED
jgi:uncharacterized protein DUF5343